MKAVHTIVAGLAVAGLVGAVALADRSNPTTVKVKKIADGAAGSTAAAGVGMMYTTGFEAAEGHALGFIGDDNHPAGCGGAANPCWGVTAAANHSLVEGHIDGIHPAAGTQHLRVSPDPATRTNQPGFGLGVDARFPRTPDLSARPIAANTVSVDVAIDFSFGQDFRVQPQSNSYGLLSTSALFHYAGGLYILDDLCGGALGFQPTGVFWDTTGGYQNYNVVMNPCNAPNPCGCGSQVDYSYGGVQVYSGCAYAGQALEQFLVFGDNYPGSSIDIDNLSMEAADECPSTCGNGIIEPPNESCETNDDSACPGRCLDCVCQPICTLVNPCILQNGANGPFVPPCDPAFGCIFLYDSAVDAVSIDTCGSDFDTVILYWGSANDAGDPGNANDDCDNGPYGAGADPSAPCYNNNPEFESCTCHDLPMPGDTQYIGQMTGVGGLPPGGSLIVNINKKAVCGGGHLGACCDTNGADQGCTDSVLSGDCQGADKVWTENGKCADIVCECIPLCAGLQCGDDGCGGSCGDCDDGNVCNGTEDCNPLGQCAPGTPLVCNDGNACNGVEGCMPSTGCTAGTPLVCDDGEFCNGTETCDTATGCVPGANPCPANETCDEATDTCVANSIPTVSEWGLVALTLMLLIGAKVSFSRRRFAGAC